MEMICNEHSPTFNFRKRSDERSHVKVWSIMSISYLNPNLQHIFTLSLFHYSVIDTWSILCNEFRALTVSYSVPCIGHNDYNTKYQVNLGLMKLVR